jgi:ATP-dependent Clp protease ATP-binding subunit ClpC
LRIGKSAQNDMTLSDVLKPYLEKRQFQFILIATPEEWKIVQEKDRRFADLFQTFRVEEPSIELASKMVLQQRKKLELDYNCQIGIQAINQLFVIQRNYLQRKALPGSVMKLLKQLAIKYKFGVIEAQHVRDEFQEFSGIDQEIFDENYTFEEHEVRDKIAASLVGQEAAVNCLVNVVNVVKAKLNNPNKPLGSFLFIGPTGVGKTQAAKVLTEYLMGDADQMIRFDMNEYIDGSAVQRLIGDYYNPEGQLTGKVRYRPFGVLLLDEIEKAHPKVHDLLLQVLDDGRLTDSLGRTVDFSNMIIIMTSNIGARDISAQLGYKTNQTDDKAVYRKAVENHFRPEFVNRIDEIVIFNNLKFPHILNIARLQINELLRRDGFVRRTTLLNISQDALEWVAKRGYDSQMGGRALKRQIERDLTALSAEQLIETYTDKPIIFEIGYDDNRLIPNLLPLEFVEQLSEDWLPEIPTEKKGKRFYSKLLRIVENISEDILDLESETLDDVIDTNADLDWQSYAFKDKVSEVKELLQTTLLGFSNHYYIAPPAIPFRMKRVGVNIRGNFKNINVHERQVMQDRFFQKNAFEEIREGYLYGMEAFDKPQSQFLEHYLDVAFLQLAVKGFIRKQSDKITISFESKINNQGSDMIDFLFLQYLDLVKAMDLAFEIDKEKRTISAEGHSIYELFKSESGIHLFYVPYQNPVPIQVKITTKKAKAAKLSELKVIRLYDKFDTLTDLRTGLTNTAKMNIGEFRLLLYAGLK